MRRFSFIFILIFLVGCDTRSKREIDEDKKRGMSSLIVSLEGSSCVESKYIGYAGTPSQTYEIYDRLLKIVPDSLWWRLTFSKSGVMRYYAFQTLLMKNDPRLVEVVNRLKNDTTFICCHRADLDLSNTVGFLVRHASYQSSAKINVK